MGFAPGFHYTRQPIGHASVSFSPGGVKFKELADAHFG
jgi:hypothetical protein